MPIQECIWLSIGTRHIPLLSYALSVIYSMINFKSIFAILASAVITVIMKQHNSSTTSSSPNDTTRHHGN